MLLKDGVKYFPHEYSSEQELEQMVTEHYMDIFGNDTMFFDPQTMTTNFGISARSDGLVLSLDQKQWFILEVELAKHPFDKHIIPQITRFNVALQQPETKIRLINSVASLIKQDPFKTASALKRKIDDVSNYLAETFQNPPTIAIVIDEKTPEVEPFCKSLPFKTRITEFKTYVRENASSVHIHSFEPLYERPPIPKTLQNVLTVFELIYKRGETYDDAIEIAAKKLQLEKNGLRALCTRDLGLTAEQFRKIVSSSEKIKQLLIQKFPEHADKIKESIP